MAKSFRVSIIGAGNLACNLAPELENAGHIIETISSLRIESAESLASRLYNTRAIDHTDLSEDDSEIVFLAVRDDVIEYLLPEIVVPKDTILVHCSGFASLNVLDAYDGPSGVFYPLQSFSKDRRKSFKDIPICIESYDDAVVKDLEKLANTISRNVSFVSSEERKKLHLAAVFANNFVNHMFSISEDILQDTSLNISLLYPLLRETIEKAFNIGPRNSQTGPAKRKDLKTIQAHLEMLESNPEIAELYDLITRQILDSAD